MDDKRQKVQDWLNNLQVGEFGQAADHLRATSEGDRFHHSKNEFIKSGSSLYLEVKKKRRDAAAYSVVLRGRVETRGLTDVAELGMIEPESYDEICKAVGKHMIEGGFIPHNIAVYEGSEVMAVFDVEDSEEYLLKWLTIQLGE